MNWFARYEIPGLYLVGLLGAIWCIFWGVPEDKDHLTAILGAGIVLSLPLGYILIVLCQWFYYKCPLWQIHRPAFKQAQEESKKAEDKSKFEKYLKMNEWQLEAEATILARVECSKPEELKKGQWVQEWFTKRFDVIAINFALMVASVIGVLFCWPLIGLMVLICLLKEGELDLHKIGFALLVIGFATLVVLISVLSNCLLKKQAIRIATRYIQALVT